MFILKFKRKFHMKSKINLLKFKFHMNKSFSVCVF